MAQTIKEHTTKIITMMIPQSSASTSTSGNADETTSLLSSRSINVMDPPALDTIENGYGTPDAKKKADDREDDGYATSETCSSITNDSSTNLALNDEGREQDSEEVINKRHTWLIPFFVNIFLSCASFSIVMPSLTSYILSIKAPLAFLPWVVSSYSVGEMFGSVAIGYYYGYATKTYETIGRGPRSSMMICLCCGVVGSVLYSAASWVEDKVVAKYLLIIARLIQGIWTGGQQAVEQAYLSAAVHPSKRTEYTATLSTCGVLGFVVGPTIGALLSQIDTISNAPGIFMIIGTTLMLIQTAFFFDGKDDISSTDEDKESSDENNGSGSSRNRPDERVFNYMGVTMCMIIIYIHYYSFAVQETITAPMAMLLYRWDLLEVNSLFVMASILSLITALSVKYITRYVEDRTLLMASIFIGFLGSVFLLDKPFSPTLPVWRFLLGYSLITIAFPLGRSVVLGIFGNVLGEVNQGRWMGIIFAISAFPRVIGPFVSLELLVGVDWQTWLEFGITSVLFGMTLLATWRNIDVLVPYADFAEEEKKKLAKMRKANMRACHRQSQPSQAL